jgi:ClpP class serine protease
MVSPPSQVAVVLASGPIMQGRAPPGRGSQIEAYKLVKLLQKLRGRDDVKAVVIRVDSSGQIHGGLQ